MSSIRYLHDVHAYNYRMTNIQATFLYEQLNDIDNILANKKQIFDNYETLFEPLISAGKVSLFKKEENTENANWIFAIRIVGKTKSIEETTDFLNHIMLTFDHFFIQLINMDT